MFRSAALHPLLLLCCFCLLSHSTPARRRRAKTAKSAHVPRGHACITSADIFDSPTRLGDELNCLGPPPGGLGRSVTLSNNRDQASSEDRLYHLLGLSVLLTVVAGSCEIPSRDIHHSRLCPSSSSSHFIRRFLTTSSTVDANSSLDPPEVSSGCSIATSTALREPPGIVCPPRDAAQPSRFEGTPQGSYLDRTPIIPT